MHYVYMLQSMISNKTYIGSTSDLRKRLSEHNSGKSISTKRDGPWSVLYYEAFAKEGLARDREKKLKYDGNATRELKKRLGLINKSGAAYTKPSAAQAGFSIIELLIASAIALLVISSIYVVSFGNQGTVLNGETNAEATTKTQALIEQQQASGRQDFNLVNTAYTTDGMYKKGVEVKVLSDLLTKQVTASTTWKGQHGENLSVEITTLVTTTENVSSPNSCNSSLTNAAGWKTPLYYYFDFLNLLPPPNSNGVPLSDIEVLNKRMYVTSNSPPNTIPQSFYIFDLSTNPSVAPTLRGRVDNNAGSIEGIAAITIASTTSNVYAYAANMRQSNFSTCPVAAANCAQLQIINATNPTAPAVVTNFLVATNTAPFVLGSAGQAVGKSVFYKDGYLYLGLTKTSSGPEFIILDVGGGGVGTPTAPKYVGSFSVGFTVNAIIIRGDFAYLTTTDVAVGNKRLLILNISDKTSPRLSTSPVGGFFTAGGIGAGNAISVVGTKIYFGTAFSGAAVSNFFILDGTNPGSYPSAVPQYGAGTIAGTTDSVNAITVRDYLAFLLTNKQFQVWNVSNPASPTPWTTTGAQAAFLNLSLLNSNGGTASDCEGNTFYLALQSSTGNSKDIIGVVTTP